LTQTRAGLARRVAPWALAWLAISALLWALDMGSGLELADQAWFVQVLERIRGGEDLYGDVFFGVPPFSVWASLPGHLLWGGEAAIRALNAATAAATALVAVHVSRQLGVAPAAQALAGLASVAYLILPTVTPYNPLAYLFLLLALDRALRWVRASAEEGPAAPASRRALLAGGAAAGLSIAAKHSVGLGALAALTAVIALLGARARGEVRGRAADAGAAIATAVAVVAAMLFPVALSGSLSDFWAYAFEKGEYVRSASVSYLNGFDILWDMLGRPLEDPGLLLAYLAFTLPPLAFAGLAFAARADPGRAFALAAFMFAALVSALPRAHLYQVAFAIPVAAVCIAWSLSELSRGAGAALRNAATAALAVVLVLTIALGQFAPVLDALERGDSPSDIDHLSGPLIQDETERSLRELAADLAAADAARGPTMVLSPHAGTAYLVSGIEDPTPFDYPLNTAVRDSDAGLIAAIEDGEIQQVCLGPFEEGFEPLAPDGLIGFVKGEMVAGETLGDPDFDPLMSCTLYARAPGQAG
jgi:hypothetical protein